MSRWRGELEALFAALCFGLAPIFAKKGLMSGLNPFYGVAISIGTALLVNFGFVSFTGKGMRWTSIERSSLFFALLAGLCNTAAIICYFSAMSLGMVALIVPITCIYPLFTLLAAYLFMRGTEAINRYTVMGTFFIVSGVILLAF
jgi:transporter family protein